MERLLSARADGTYPQLMNQYINTELLILDEIGFQRIDTENVNDFFEIVRRRYEHGSMILTQTVTLEIGEKFLEMQFWHQPSLTVSFTMQL
jgi:DNA replication protein DnaC